MTTNKDQSPGAAAAPGPGMEHPGRFLAGVLLLTRTLAALGAACVAVLAVLTVAAVVMRYGLGAPFRFTDELGGLLLVSSVFLSLPHVLASNANIRVTLVSDRLNGLPRRAVWILGQLILVAFAAVFLRDALAEAQFTQKLNLRSEVARIPLSPFVWLMVAGMALVAFIGAFQALGKAPSSGPGPHP